MTVLAAITDLERAAPLSVWALRLAQRLECEVELLWPLAAGLGEGPRDLHELGELPEAAPQEAAAALAQLRQSLVEQALPPARMLSYRDDAALLEMCNRAEVKYVVVEVPQQRTKQGPSVARRLFDGCANSTVLLRLSDHAGSCDRVLVPLLRGADNGAALRLAERLGTEGSARTALAVEPRALTEAQGVGQRWIERELDDAKLDQPEAFAARVELDDSPEAAIAGAAEAHDLVLFGASDLGTAVPNLRTPRSQLLGVVPEGLRRGNTTLTLGVVRGRWSLGARAQLRVGRWLDLLVPQLDREQRIALTEKLQSGSEWNFDFLALMALSTAIAALGLVQDSAAVVIGAMLVAPLMMPILGLGLSIVQGNLPLLRSALKALFFGYALALVISFGTGWVSHWLTGTRELTPQLLARGNPNLLDLAVALLSGIAAAYCLARPDLSAALPGVAIAAALVPPIATTGISLAAGAFEVAAGALLLFLVNVAAIVVGAFFSLYAGGLRGQPGSGNLRPWVRSAFLGALVAVALLAWPLARSTVEHATPQSAERTAQVETEDLVRKALGPDQALVGTTVTPLNRSDGRRGFAIGLEIEATSAASPVQVEQLATELAEQLDQAVELEIHTRLVSRGHSPR